MSPKEELKNIKEFVTLGESRVSVKGIMQTVLKAVLTGWRTCLGLG